MSQDLLGPHLSQSILCHQFQHAALEDHASVRVELSVAAASRTKAQSWDLTLFLSKKSGKTSRNDL